MKNINWKIIALLSSALLIGLFLGKFIWGGTASVSTSSQNQQSGTVSEQVYTCPMHPQIRQNEPGTCPICGMNLTPLKEDGAGEDDPTKLVMSEDAVRLANVETFVVGEEMLKGEELARELVLTGRVKMDETRLTTQTTHLNGRIERLFVRATNASIRKGQKLAEIYSPEFITAQNELLEAAKSKDAFPELYQAAKQKLRFWKLSESTLATIENEGLVQEKLTIYAEYAGIVMKRYAEEGDYLRKGMPLFDVMDFSKVWVLFDVYEKDLRYVQRGTTISFNLEAYPEKIYKAVVTFIDPVINPKTRVATVRVVVPNYNNRFKTDMFAKGIVKSKSNLKSRNGDYQVSVPKSAVLWTGEESVVYVKVPETAVPTFQYREVKLGESLKDHYQIESGLEIGEEVVVNGVFRIDAAAQLSNKASMMNRHILVEGQEGKVPKFKNLDKDFVKQLQALLVQYLILKDVLVQSDTSASKKAFESMGKALSNVEMEKVKDAAHDFWMEQQQGLQNHIENTKSSSDLEVLRKQFSGISFFMIQLAKAFGLKGQLYIQHCPMALNDTGADWLSKDRFIRNPYFGDKMLKCGVVKDSIP